MKPASEKSPPNLVARTGIEPVRDVAQSAGNTAPQQDRSSELFPDIEGAFGNRPQTVPTSPPLPARLSRLDLRDLMGMCDRQVGYCGVSDPAGQRALELKVKLLAIHAHGWKETA